MRHQSTFLGLPVLGLNCLCLTFGVFIVCLGIRTVRGADIALETANTKLTATGSIRRLESQAYQLQQQAELIKEKDKAYQELQATYERSLKGKVGYERLQSKIEQVDKIPNPENIDLILDELEATEQLLIDTTNE